jgi:hypothetical protein
MSTRRLFRRAFGAIVASSTFVVACGWDPSRPFEREAPQVREAIALLDGGDAHVAGDLLADYLSTGACKEGSIGTPPRVRERSNGSFDLGLAIFQVAETYGRRFGDEESDAGEGDSVLENERNGQVDCGLKLVRAVGTDPSQPVDLRARARYLEGNLLLLNKAYEEAVRAYDASLELAPGMHDSGPITVGEAGRTYNPDLLGRDAAWNRAIALRRIEDKKDAGNDGGDDGGTDGGGDGGDTKKDNNDAGNGDKPDAGKDGGGTPDAGKDGGSDDPNKPKPDKPEEKPDAAPPPPPSRQNQDERMLDQLENAPTVQQEAARKQAQKRRPARGMSDK